MGKLRKAAAVLEDGEDELDSLSDEDLEELLGVTELEQIFPTRVDAVDQPANGFPALMMKSAGSRRLAGGGPRLAARLVKSDGERRFTLHVCYPSNRADRARAADGHVDFAGPEAVEEAAWSFMKSGQAIGLDHAEGTEGAGQLVESSIYRGPRWVIKAVDGSEQVVEPGDWIIGVQWSPETWQMVKAGRVNGVSMQGGAVRRKPTREALAGLRKAGSAGGMEVSTKAAKQLRKAARQAVHDEAAHLRRQAESLGRKVDRLEKSRRPKCEHCGKRAGSPVSRFCTKCGHPLAGAVGKSVVPAPELVLTRDEALHLAAVMRKAQSADREVRLSGIAKLADLVGTDVAVRIMSGDMLSPETFTRAYLRHGRQRQEGAGGKPPRIPVATHVISADDFRRGPLGAGQSRPAPGSVWPGSGGQRDHYGPGAGVRAPYVAGQGVRAGLAGSRGAA